MEDQREPLRQKSIGGVSRIDWRKTTKFFLILTSPAWLLGLYILGVKLLAISAFGDFGE